MRPHIAICFHLGYACRFEEFTSYIDVIIGTSKRVDLYITYRENVDMSSIYARYPHVKLLKSDRGCDTGAFLLQIKQMLESGKEYDYVFKLHTKSNVIGGGYGSKWKSELLNPTAGTHHSVKKIYNMFKTCDKIGMICSKKWLLACDIKYHNFEEICNRNNISKCGSFVGGTIFWIRFDCIKRIFTHINIDREYALCELGKPTEPSYTHAWERIYGLIVSTTGYYVKGI